VHAGRHVDDAALHAGRRRRLRHPPQQQLRQQEVACRLSEIDFQRKPNAIINSSS